MDQLTEPIVVCRAANPFEQDNCLRTHNVYHVMYTAAIERGYMYAVIDSMSQIEYYHLVILSSCFFPNMTNVNIIILVTENRITY